MSNAVEVVEPGRVVEARSSQRLPFEPTGRLREFRTELARACRTLHADRGEILRAIYNSPRRDTVDLENVLTYDLGTGALGAAARHGLVLERSFRATGDPDHEHRYRYEIVDAARPEQDAPWDAIELVAPAAFSDPKAGRWWMLAARAGVTVGRDLDEPPERFALTITVTPPVGWRGSLITLLKPLTDGLVSAMHRHDGPPDVVLDRAHTLDPGLGPAEMHRLLCPERAPLGATRLVWPRGDGLQWSPADDRIVRLDARVCADGPPGRVRAEVHRSTRV